MSWLMWPWVTLLALLLDYAWGYPQVLQRSIGHPVEWMGWLIEHVESVLNIPYAEDDVGRIRGRLRGFLALVVLTCLVMPPVFLFMAVTRDVNFGWIVQGVVASSLLAQRSLRVHFLAVRKALTESLGAGREAVSRIVGRDVGNLDEDEVAAAAIESLAESSCDGVVAPLMFLLVFGLPGLVFYKLVNTADSMVGHRTERYRYFGWIFARFDDLLNRPGKNWTAALLGMASLRWGVARFRKTWAMVSGFFGTKLFSLSGAGYVEAVMAAALGITLGGPRSYDGVSVEMPYLGKGPAGSVKDMEPALELYDTMTILLIFLHLQLVFVTILYPDILTTGRYPVV